MIMKKQIFIDIHAIQTVPPSCVNRDDTGSPKTATYGGVERARVSSQAWKHSMRAYFRDIFESEDMGSRTKHIIEKIAGYITSIDPSFDDEKAAKAAQAAVEAIGIKIDKKTNENSALFFHK